MQMLNVILYLGRKCLFREWWLSKFFQFRGTEYIKKER